MSCFVFVVFFCGHSSVLSSLFPGRLSARFLTASCFHFSLSVLFAMISKNLVAVQNPGRKENLSFFLSPGGGAVTVTLCVKWDICGRMQMDSVVD